MELDKSNLQVQTIGFHAICIREGMTRRWISFSEYLSNPALYIPCDERELRKAKRAYYKIDRIAVKLANKRERESKRGTKRI